jgi:UDP-N-acetylmuramyl pentapeptide phosphotransferase/UDP-N-acetylglucosamine-1-phosphate transferase
MILFLTSAIASWLLGFFVWWILRRWNVVDKPNTRSSHVEPTVRGGGMGIIAVILAGLAVASVGVSSVHLTLAWIIGIGIIALAVVSMIDDLRSIGAASRFGCHALVAAAFLWGLSHGINGAGAQGLPALPIPLPLFFVIGFLWLAGYTNVFNFMDGINGIAGG